MGNTSGLKTHYGYFAVLAVLAVMAAVAVVLYPVFTRKRWL
ncbi:hypothetical protein [Kribbella aluminosa]|nr:hypothetical protein [Kribbella aluminosa]